MDVIRVGCNDTCTVIGKICDKCGRRASVFTDCGELQEFVRVNIEVGYGTTAFDDGDLLQADLCQTCTKALLGPYLRVVSTFDERIRALQFALPLGPFDC